MANGKVNKEKNGVSKDGYQNETQQSEKKPSNMTICYFLGVAYASSVGGVGRIIGNDTTFAFQTIYETRFPDSPSVGFAAWMFLNVPIMLITMFLAWLWLQFSYMGLFKPNSEDAKRVKLGKQAEQMARKKIELKLEEIGPISFHEAMLGLIFVLTCSHAFSLPLATHPNNIDTIPYNISTEDMVPAGLGVKVISILILFGIFLLLGPPVFGVNEFPSWAGNFTGN